MAGIGMGEVREEEGKDMKKAHKRSHSRNKSLAGRHDFIEEIANGGEKLTKSDAPETEEQGESEALLTPPSSNNKEEEQVKANSKTSIDETDALPESLRYNWFDLMCTLISVVTYLADLTMDCVIAYYFYHLSSAHGIHHYWYFGLTVFFIVMPSLTMTGFSFRWYLMDSDNPQLPRVSIWRWLLRLIVLVLQVAPVLRYFDSMRYGILSRVAKYREERATDQAEKEHQRRERVKWYTLMVYEDADATLLRLYESFMESAPQLVLQIYILLKDPQAGKVFPVKTPSGEDAEHPQWESNEPVDISTGVNPYLKLSLLAISVTCSLISLAWSLVVYHRSLRYTYPHKNNISLVGTLFQFLWHFCSITARVLALSLFATAMPLWIGPLCAAHWLVMASWVIFQRTTACNTQCEEFLFALVLGVIYIFMFFNAKEERTRYKYLLYYGFSFVENTAIILVWFFHTPSTTWYVLPALSLHYLTFILGLLFMLCYYLWFHPTGVQIIVRQDSVRAVPEAPMTELVQLSKEPERGGKEQMQDMPVEEMDTDHGGEGEKKQKLLPQMEKLALGKSISSPLNPPQRGQPPARMTSVPYASSSDLSAARKLKYMGQKPSDVV